MNEARFATVDDPGQLADVIRREFGADLPAARPRESHREREFRQEQTKWVLETEVMPRVNEARVGAGNPVLTVEQEDRVVELVLSAMFLLPHLLGILDGEPLAEDGTILGASPVRIDRADGTKAFHPPMVSEDQALQRVIAKVAEDHHRPFNFERPWVDIQLSDRLRFHGEGFDIVKRPAIFIRVHRVLGALIADMFEAGMMSAGIAYVLDTAVPEAGLTVAISGVQGSGKTTVGRAIALAHPEDTRWSTVETDFELGLHSLGLEWVHEMQARLPVTSKDRGITCGELMVPSLRTRSDRTFVGEVRGDEGPAAIRAAGFGQGTMVTVHGNTAAAGLEQLVDRVCEGGTSREIAIRMVYQSFDLVVHCAMSRDRRRWIGEIVHPLMEGDQPKLHTLYEPAGHVTDVRARLTTTAWPAQLLSKLRVNFPEFDLDRARDDTYRPHGRLGVLDPARNGAEVPA
jgi:pilus assembly protein CpaF